MSNNNKIQTGINNISNEWFRANIDRKTLKNLSKRTDYEGWKHIIIFSDFLFSVPITTLSGLIKSLIADPSRRNSGLDTTSKSF